MATPDQQIVVGGDRRVAFSNRTDGMDLHAALYGRMSVENSQRRAFIPALETHQIRLKVSKS